MPGQCSFQHTGSGLLLPPQNSHALHLHSAQWVLCFLSSLHQVAHRASVLSSAVCGTHGADAIVVGGRAARLRELTLLLLITAATSRSEVSS